MCGENTDVALRDWLSGGSPPRVRGKHFGFTWVEMLDRITPACAGKTDLHLGDDPEEEDHPRVCGENIFRIYTDRREQGSPPRVRGKHFGNGVFPWLILVLSLDPL